MDIKTKAQSLYASTQPRNVEELKGDTESIYEVLAAVSQRSKQIAVALKIELQEKLRVFEEDTETIEEITENKEQIEISKFYERLANPSIIALEEYRAGEMDYRKAKDLEDQ